MSCIIAFSSFLSIVLLCLAEVQFTFYLSFMFLQIIIIFFLLKTGSHSAAEAGVQYHTTLQPLTLQADLQSQL